MELYLCKVLGSLVHSFTACAVYFFILCCTLSVALFLVQFSDRIHSVVQKTVNEKVYSTEWKTFLMHCIKTLHYRMKKKTLHDMKTLQQIHVMKHFAQHEKLCIAQKKKTLHNMKKWTIQDWNLTALNRKHNRRGKCTAEDEKNCISWGETEDRRPNKL